MRKNQVFPVIVAGILIILTLMYIGEEHLKRERESDIARNSGTDELSRIISAEADAYKYANMKRQRILLATGIVVVFVSGAWWVGQRMRKPE